LIYWCRRLRITLAKLTRQELPLSLGSDALLNASHYNISVIKMYSGTELEKTEEKADIINIRH
jgi:hypothetical protein